MDVDGIEQVDLAPAPARRPHRRGPRRDRVRTSTTTSRRAGGARRRRQRPDRQRAPTATTRSRQPAPPRGARSPAWPPRSTSARRGRSDALTVNGLGGDDRIDAAAWAPTCSSPRTAATATTRSSAAAARRRDRRRRQRRRSTATRATTWRSWAPATTASPGTRATAATSSRARPARDAMTFNGANIAEQFDVSANGGRVRFSRDVGEHHDGPQRRRGDRHQRAGRRRPARPSATSPAPT